MFTVTCTKCGSGMQLDEAAIPPSGMVKKCPKCGNGVTVMPPSGGVGAELDLADMAPIAPPPSAGRAAPRRTGPPSLELDEPGGGQDIIDLPAPKGPTASRGGSPALEEPDLLAPVGPSPTRGGGLGIPDLPAPVGPKPTRGAAAMDEPDLLAPVGPVSQRNVPDLLAPVGPVSQKNLPDLLAPVGPVSQKNLPDLLAPVGPVSQKNLPDLLAPVGPVSQKNVPDLLAPVGPVSKKNAPDLLAPVGPTPTRGAAAGPAQKSAVPGAPDLLTAIGATPAAPETSAPSFFDGDGGGSPGLELDSLDLSPAAPAAPAARQPAGLSKPPPIAPPSLDLELPAPEPPKSGGIGLSFNTPSGSGSGSVPALDLGGPVGGDSGGSGLSLDMLDLAPAGDGGKSGPKGSAVSLDLEAPADAPSAPAGVVSFGKPSGNTIPPPVAPPPARNAFSAPGAPPTAALDLADPGAVAKKPAAKAPVEEVAPEAAPSKREAKGKKVAAEKSPAQKRKQMIALAVIGVLVLGGGAGVYVKMRMDAAEALALRIKTGLADARKLMVSDEADHWDKAGKTAAKVLKDDKKNADALGMAAQAQLAWAIDSGQKVADRRAAADDLLNDATAGSIDGPEIDKARALAMILDDKAADAQQSLAKLAGKQRDADTPLFLGWAALAAGDHKEARKAFEAALVRQNARVPALFGLGQAQLALGDAEGARKSFDAVLAKRTNHVGAWVALASMLPKDRNGTREKRFLEIVGSEHAAAAHPRDVSKAWTLAGDEALAAHHWDDATVRYKKAEDLDPDNVDAIVGRGDALAWQGNMIEAEKLFVDVHARQPQNVRALLGLARVSLATSKNEAARGYVEDALKVRAEDPAVQLWYGRVLEAAPAGSGLDNAIQAYQKAAQLDPGNYEPVVALSLLYLKKGQPDLALRTLAPIQKDAEQDPWLANTLGAAFLAARDFGQAEKWFRLALARDATNVDAQANLGRALKQKGDATGALDALEKAARLDAGREDVKIELAMAYEGVKRYADAEKLYAAMISEDGGRKPSLAGRAAAGRWYARRGNLEKVTALGRSIGQDDPRHSAGMFLRGLTALADGQPIEAQKILMEAIAIDPQAQYYEALGRALEAQNSLEEANNYYTSAIKADERYAEPLIDRARIYQKRRMWDDSRQDLELAQKLDPDRYEVYTMLGDSYFEPGEKKKAVDFYKQGVAKNPSFAEGWFKLGRAYYDLDKGGDAIAAMRKATELADPKDEWLPDAWLILGYTLKSTGARAEACRAFNRFIEIAPPTAAAKNDVKTILLSCP